MAITRERLELLITGDARDAVMAMRQASGAAGGLDDSVAGSATRMTRLGAVAGVAGDHIRQNIGMYSVAAVAALGAAVAKSLREFTDLADKIRDFGRVSGLGADQSSRLVAIFDDLEISQKSADTAFFRLNRTIASNSSVLESYGIQVRRSRDGNVDAYKTLLSVADAYESTSDSGRRAELVQAAFGRGGAELIPILERGRKGIEELYGNVPEGQILSDEQVAQARAYELAVDDLGDSLNELQVSLGSRVAPALAGVASAAAVAIRGFDDLLTATASLDEELGNTGLFDNVFEITGFLARKIAEGPGGIWKNIDEIEDSTKRLEEAEKKYVEIVAEGNKRTAEGEEAARKYRQAKEGQEELINRVSGALENEQNKIDGVKTAQYELINLGLGVAGAQLNLEAATNRYNESLAQNGAEALETRQAYLQLQQATLAYGDAVKNEQEKATGSTDVATQAQISALKKVADSLAPDSPLRRNLNDWIYQLKYEVPAYVDTRLRLSADTSAARAELEAMGIDLPDYGYVPQGFVVGATGGIVNRPTMALIGEAGPEAVIPLSKVPGNEPLPAFGSGSMSITVPLVVDGRVLAEVTASELNRPGGPVIKQRAIV